MAKASKTTAAKATTKKPAAKAAKGKKAKAPELPTELGKPKTKTELFDALAAKTEMSRKEVSAFIDALKELVCAEVGAQGPGVVSLPGLVKFQRQYKPPVEEHEKENPFNRGEMMTVKAKPASLKVKTMPLKDLKDAINPEG